MKLENLDPHTLVPNPWNSNKVDRVSFEKLKKSVTTLGNFKPVVVRDIAGKYEILGGYHRTEAAKELGLATIPVLILESISDQKAKEISLIDNARYGQDDAELLEKLINSMDTEFIGLVIPETEELELPNFSETPITEFEESITATAPTTKDDDGVKTLRFRYDDLDKADEIEDLLLKVAKTHNYYFADGYANLADALYHALIMDRK
jgi:hypothetical protein